MSLRALHINDLPSETLQAIFAYLPQLVDRKMLSLVCPLWNDLAFDYSFLGRIKLCCYKDIVNALPKISRSYRVVSIRFDPYAKLDEEYIRKMLIWFKQLSASLEEFDCSDFDLLESLALKILTICPCVKKVQLDSSHYIPDDKLPVLEKLEELVIKNTTFINLVSLHCKQLLSSLEPGSASTLPVKTNLIRLAPNLRSLQATSKHFDLPMVVQNLPLENLNVSLEDGFDIFRNCSDITKLTSVRLFSIEIDQQDLEQLCKFCPLLTKLALAVIPTASLECLAALTHLKVLSLFNHHHDSFTNKDFCLSSVEIVEFVEPNSMHFDTMQRIFPNVHYLKFWYNLYLETSGKIIDGFPHLRTLELQWFWHLELLEGLSNLRELIVHRSQLSGSGLTALQNLHKLTLNDSVLDEVTDELELLLPNLKFLDLLNNSQCCAEKLPPGCTIRQCLSKGSTDLFDCIK